MPSLDKDGFVALDPDSAAALDALRCPLCDERGYRGLRVCDHIDHASETAHGRALVQAELDKIRARKAKP